MALDPNKFNKVDYHEGIVRTSVVCSGCNGASFIAKLNYDIDGDHRIVCPRCGRRHYRTIQKGVVTETRWKKYPGGEEKYIDAPTERIWNSDDGVVQTATPAEFIRSRFIKD